MILYHNKNFLRTLLARSGSVFFRASSIIPGCILGLVTLVLQVIIDSGSFSFDIPNNWSMSALGVSLTFAIVFRTQNGWQRYWEAITQLHFMYSKMADCFCQFHAFAMTSIQVYEKKGDSASLQKAADLWNLLHTMEHSFVLLSGFAAHRLSHGDNQRMEKRSHMRVNWKLQSTTRSALRAAEDISGATKGPTFVALDDHGVPPPEEQNDWDASYWSINPVSEDERNDILKVRDRVNFCMYRILRLMSGCAGDLTIPPPIQSRMYQELSNSMLGFSNALKIADVPFPLPFAQILIITLVAWSIIVPIYVANFTQHVILGPFLTFCIFEAVWCLNEVAKELENPYGSDANDISLPDFHARFVEILQDTTQEVLPEFRTVVKPRSKPAEDPSMLEKASTAAPTVSVDMSKAQPRMESSSVAPAPEPKQEDLTKLLVPLATKGGHVEVIDQQLAQITERMEQHLVRIAEELSRTSSMSQRMRGIDFADTSSVLNAVHPVTVEVTKEEAFEVMRRRAEMTPSSSTTKNPATSPHLMAGSATRSATRNAEMGASPSPVMLTRV